MFEKFQYFKLYSTHIHTKEEISRYNFKLKIIAKLSCVASHVANVGLTPLGSRRGFATYLALRCCLSECISVSHPQQHSWRDCSIYNICKKREREIKRSQSRSRGRYTIHIMGSSSRWFEVWISFMKVIWFLFDISRCFVRRDESSKRIYRESSTITR